MPFFKNVFKSKDASRAGSRVGHDAVPAAPPKPRWEDSWSRKDVAPEEIQELIHVCTQEMKSRALDMPFMLLPFRPTSDVSASRNFIRSFFKATYEGTGLFTGDSLAQELRLAEPLTLCSILKWCWSRLPGGIVTWDAYELFRIGESDSNFARHAFDTFIPISVESDARKNIIFEFFDLLSSVAARGKTNGMGGRKLSRLAGWWAFEFVEDGKGFEGGYHTWEKAADAASHLFFAYLRSLSPDLNQVGAISTLPRSLQALLSQTEYPPQIPTLMQTPTTKVVMIVDSVSPTPFSLLRRAKHFEYRDDDAALQQFSAFEDTVKALTDECRRVLECISTANQSVVSPTARTPDPSWSRFEDMGFSGILESSADTMNGSLGGGGGGGIPREFSSMHSGPQSAANAFGRPTTPSWADFLSSGFADENNHTPPTTLLLPTQKLPPLGEVARVHSSQSHVRNGIAEEDLEPGELASITQFDLDETFWWVWMTSLASEETTERKAAFGRCTLIETQIPGVKWLVMEEQVKGASSGPEEGAYIAEKKSKFSFTKRGRLGRRKSTGKKTTSKEPYNRAATTTPLGKSSIAPDQHAKIQAAAARLAQDDRNHKDAALSAQRRGRIDDMTSVKTNSVLTLQPHLLNEAGPAMKWDKKFGEAAIDKDALRAQYLGDVSAGKGAGPKDNTLSPASARSLSLSPDITNRDLPALPRSEMETSGTLRANSRSPARLSANTPPVDAVSATRVPWPTDSPTQTPVAKDKAFATMAPVEQPFPASLTEDKSTPPIDTVTQHPALREDVSCTKLMANLPNDAPLGEVPSQAPEQKQSPTRLKKKEGGGLRKLFGRKKTDHVEPAKSRQHEDGRFSPMPDVSRSASRFEDHPAVPEKASPRHSVDEVKVIQDPSPEYEQTTEVSSSVVLPESHAPTSPGIPSAPATQQEIDQAFTKFDQGPMEDMPAFVPADVDSSDDEAAAAPSIPRRQVPHYSAIQDPVPPTQYVPQPSDDISEKSIELTRHVSPSQDRWAQIRKNAAERAQRLSEEQVRRSRSQSQSQRTDEGETSGEETIESRVARIKARVAELTGNVDGQTTGSGGEKRW